MAPRKSPTYLPHPRPSPSPPPPPARLGTDPQATGEEARGHHLLPTSPPCGVYGADAASTGECARVTSRGPTREPAREGDSPPWTRAWRRPLRRCPFLPPSGQHPAAARVGAGHAGGRSGIRRADGHVPTMVGSVNGIPYGNKPDEDNYLVWRFQMGTFCDLPTAGRPLPRWLRLPGKRLGDRLVPYAAPTLRTATVVPKGPPPPPGRARPY